MTEPIPDSALLHLDFETTDGLRSVEQLKVEAGEDDPVTGAAAEAAVTHIVDSEHAILLAEGQGAAGNALYLDGKYGVDFDMPEIADDSYTISFWVNADRLSTYGPTVQVGRNVASDTDVTWINFTETDWPGNKIFPVAWNRNSNLDVWPWIYAMDGDEGEAIHGKREWCLVTLVVDGQQYTADDGTVRVGSKFYLDGELKIAVDADNAIYHGIAPEIFKGADGLEGHIGINYWDTVFKGFIDVTRLSPTDR